MAINICGVVHFLGERWASFHSAQPTALSLYGGMGSLNDLILYKDGQPLAKENVELDSFRIKLHALCHG
ncbi:DUF6966 domain-containing protein [Chromobacterium violaceum]|uniref:DUF6966 domain-containing protein n=1 Tax=Chromobacterium violaceum TaxID=536 RepID=UPI003CC8327A